MTWVIAGAVTLERFERGDDAVQVVLHLAQVSGQAGLAVRVGAGDEPQVDRGLAAVGVEESGVVWKSGQVRQALGCGQSCCGGRPQ